MNHISRKIICLFMAVLIITLTACSGKQAGKESGAGETTAAIETEQAETPAETKKEETAETRQAQMQETKGSPEETESTAEETQKQQASRTNALLHLLVENRMIGSTDQEGGVTKAKAGYPAVTLDEGDSAAFPALAQALKTLNSEVEESFQASLAELEANFAEITGSNPEMAENLELCNELTVNVVRADSIALSLVGLRYAYYGGAHPDHFTVCYNFDADSGKQLMLSDVITDMDAFVQVVDTKLNEQYWDIYPTFFITPREAMAAIDTEEAGVVWSLGYEGITLYFNPYCLGSYAMGQQVIYLPFTEIPDLVTAYYSIERADYVTPISSELPVYADVTGNGQVEEISLRGEYLDDEEYACNVIVSSGNRSCDPNAYAYSHEAWLVKSDGQYYVWLFACAESDYVLLSCVDLKTMSCDSERQVNLFLPTLEGDWQQTETGYVTWGKKECFTDPEQIELGSTVSLLSTLTGRKLYHVGSDGWPEAEEQLYRFEQTNVLRAKRSLTAQLVDEEGNVTGTAEIPAGVFLAFVRGDGENFADFQEIKAESADISEYGDTVLITQGKAETDWSQPVYRIYEDKSKWPYTIDGIEESNCFDGIMYAG